jgi:hypothetical protein
MSLRIRFRFDGRCSVHPRYNPEKDGGPQHKECHGCESLHVIHLYCGIARKKAETGEGLAVSCPEIHTEPTERMDASEDVSRNEADKHEAV